MVDGVVFMVRKYQRKKCARSWLVLEMFFGKIPGEWGLANRVEVHRVFGLTLSSRQRDFESEKFLRIAADGHDCGVRLAHGAGALVHSAAVQPCKSSEVFTT